MTISDRVAALGHDLPPATLPAGTYRPWVRSGNTVYFSGQVCKHGPDAAYVGKVGLDFTLDEGREAAVLAALNLLAQMDQAAKGDPAVIRQICRLGGFVNATDDFRDLSKVIDAASELLGAVFGDVGCHARTAVGVATLPRGVAVELEAIVEFAD